MKRDFDLPILQLDGSQFDDKPTLKTVAFMALTTALESDRNADGPTKLKLYTLASLLHKGGVVEVSAEDVALLKERIGKAFGVVVVGRAYELLEQDIAMATQAEFDAAVDRRDMPSGAAAPQ